MDTPTFMPIKTYLKSIEFDSPNTPEMFFNANSAANLEISIDVQSSKYDGSNIQQLVTNEDLMQWGYMPELLGRIGECIVMNPLTSDVIYEIMTSAKDNILQSHIDFCSNNNVDLVFE